MVRQSLVLLIVALGVFAASDSAGQVGPPATRNDEEAIKHVIAATTDAFSRHDAKAWVMFCTPDAQLVTVRGESMNGVGEIEQGLTTIFQTRGRTATLKTLDVAVRFIRPDVALAHVTNQLSGLVSPEGQTLPSHQELSIRVLVKDQGAWRITAFHNTIVQKSSARR
ncbi:MAG: SgcJ/EcaC family oxidoreductase [Acidobacteria bacterium]|nr:SgcJ/EcaC family oxidoreductase [Acidobacteriota bacterium]